MDSSYEKKWANEFAPSSANLLDESAHVKQAPVRIRHYFVFSLFSAICLCPLTGLIALAYSLKSSAKADVKFDDKARLYSRRALLWNIISIIFAVISLIMVLAFCYQINAGLENDIKQMYQQQQQQQYRLNDVNRLIQKITENN